MLKKYLKQRIPILYERMQLLKMNLRHTKLVLFSRTNKRLMAYKNLYQGKRCFIVATGPSLTIPDVDLLKNDICFGVNSIVKVFDKTSWRPDFLCVSENRVWERIGTEIDSRAGEVDTLFVGNDVHPKAANVVKFWRDERPSTYVATDYYRRTHHYNPKYDFYISDNMDKYLCDGPTVIFSVIQLAIYMGFTEICLLGTDCNYNGAKQYSELTSYQNVPVPYDSQEQFFAGYRAVKREIENKKLNVSIYNATRGGMLEIFERKKLEELVTG